MQITSFAEVYGKHKQKYMTQQQKLGQVIHE
jgi:hypothetical protein